MCRSGCFRASMRAVTVHHDGAEALKLVTA
jgi:hypothetical protein